MLRLVLPILAMFLTSYVYADDLLVLDADGNDISVSVYPSEGDLLVIWLVDHDEQRQLFERLLVEVQRSGVEIWRVDLLESYFLSRSNETQRTLPGEGVTALLRAAHQQTDKDILLVAYDRLPLAALRGARQWQLESAVSRLLGAVFFYPNLFGPVPTAGEDPLIDPIVNLTTIPVAILQPDNGSQRWRLNRVMQALWSAGSPAIAYLIRNVRDWYIMGEATDPDPREEQAALQTPAKLKAIASLFESLPRKAAKTGTLDVDSLRPQVSELVQLDGEQQMPAFSLEEFKGGHISSGQYQGQVLLVNFWATWCPPCVEEVPSLNQLYAKYRSQGFEVVSIDFRETRKELEKFTRQVPVNFPVLLDEDGRVSLQWKVFAFPTSFLIDKKGRIRYSVNRAIDWNTEETWQLVEQLLAEPG